MAGRGKLFLFHGAFSSKARAQEKERDRPGSFIQVCRFRKRRKDGSRGVVQVRYCVLTLRKGGMFR